MTRPLLCVEIDVPVCSLTYGTSPCTAAIPTTGSRKCFNTTRTCQDKEHFTRSLLTLRFVEPFSELSFDAYPALQTVNVNPNTINPGRDMGTRSTVSISVDDFQSADVGGLDRYLADRDYVPFEQGTFWPKFRARVPSMEGFACRVRRGFVEMPLEEWTTEHYIVTSAVMDASGISIQAKDFLALCDVKQAQAPDISLGRLTTEMASDGNTFTVQPVGIGSKYRVSGKACLSGKEIVAYTRSGDDFTVVRAQAGTIAQAHKEDAIVQEVLSFDSQGADDIIRILLETYTPGFDSAWIDDDEWQTEVDTYVGLLYSADIPAPTSVATLINEVIAQAGLALWADVEAKKVRLISLRPVVPDANLYDDDLYSAGSLSVKEQPDKRVSQAWTYYGVADPTNKLDKESNFQAGVAKVGDATVLDYDLPAITKTFSRWIPATARNAAERLNDMLLARFQDAPRMLSMDFHAGIAQLPKLGTGIRVLASLFQDDTGARTAVPFFVTSVEVTPEKVSVEAEEAQFFSGSVPGADRLIFIEVDTFNVNLRELYDSLYSGVPDGMVLSVYVTSSAFVGSVSPADPAFTIGDDFPEDTTILLFVNAGGGVMGHGGNGSGYEPGLETGGQGGTAFLIQRPVTINNFGIIGGGGGGGGRITGSGTDGGSFIAAGGGGGAGFSHNAIVDGVRTRIGGSGGKYGGEDGVAPPDASSGSFGGEGAHVDFPGGTIVAGDGGYLGFAGETPHAPPGYGASNGGPGGKAVDGDSFVTWETLGHIFGARTG